MSIPDHIVEQATRSIAKDIEKHWRDEAIAAAVKKMPVWAPFSGNLLAHAELIALTFSRGYIPEMVADADRAQYVANEIRLASWGYTDQDVVRAAIGDQGQLMFDGLALRAIAERIAASKGQTLPDPTKENTTEAPLLGRREYTDWGQSSFADRPIGPGE